MTRHRRWIITSAGMILLAAASIGLIASDLNLLAIRYVGVTFHGDLAANPEIVTFLTGYAGLPVWEVSLETISETVSRYPQVKTHRITWHLTRELNIDIELKSPVAELSRGAESVFLDKEGIPFPSDPEYQSDLPRFDLLTDASLKSADDSQPDRDVYQLVLTLARNSRWTGYRTIHWMNEHDIRIRNTERGNIIRLQRRDFDIQLNRLTQYLANMPETISTEFDMRFINTLIIRKDKGAATIG